MQGENMRILCDRCSHPISGTVKKIARSLNFHPNCFAELVKEGIKYEYTVIKGLMIVGRRNTILLAETQA